jgi:DNA-binding beta-propeller fold protein YncE
VGSDGGQLFVSDTLNRRVLVYDLASLANGMDASAVLGQTDMTGNQSGTSPSKFWGPYHSAFLGARRSLVVADPGNHRVLFFDIDGGAITTGQSATTLLGQFDRDGGPVFTARCENGANPVGFFATSAAAIGAGYLFVADDANSASRVLAFRWDAGVVRREADFVVGQAGFPGCVEYAAGERGLYAPHGLAIDPVRNRLFISDYSNDRVLVYSLLDLADGMPAFAVLGRPDFDAGGSSGQTQTSLNYPSGLAFESGRERLYVSDSYAARIMVFVLDAGVITNGMPATYLIGQPTWTGGASGQTAANTLSLPKGLAMNEDAGLLFVADYNHNRVLVFDVSEIDAGEAAIHVLGQSSFDAGGAGLSERAMYSPAGLALDPVENLLFVSDSENRRVLVFDVSKIVNYEAAVNVIGAATFTDSDGGLSQSLLRAPTAIAFDPVTRRLVVGDNGNTRVLLFDVAD